MIYFFTLVLVEQNLRRAVTYVGRVRIYYDVTYSEYITYYDIKYPTTVSPCLHSVYDELRMNIGLCVL